MGSYYKKLLGDIKEKINGQEKKKLIENAVVVIIIGIIIIIAGSSIFSKGSKDKGNNISEIENENTNSVVVTNKSDEDLANSLEKKLEVILSEIYGVGKTSVMITYVSGKEIVPAFDVKSNNTDIIEKDNQGGSRSTKQNNSEESIIFIEENGVKKPIIIKDIEPVIKGVIVVAEGADDPTVRGDLTKAVQTIMDIPIHRIQVFSSKKH